MDCFRCHSPMKKFTMDGVLADKCENCQGIWLDAGELDMLVYEERKTRKELGARASLESKQEKLRLVTSSLMCPKCQQTSLHTVHLDGVELDQCSACKGLFFDWGELSRILANKKSGTGHSVKSWLRSLFK